MCVNSCARTLIIASSERKPARKIVPNSIVRGSRKATDALSRASTSAFTRFTESTRAVAEFIRARDTPVLYKSYSFAS